MFIVNEPKKKFVKVTEDDKAWCQTDGMVVYTRAGLEISPECPDKIVWLLHNAINKGWLKQVAYVEEKTLMWETLQK